MPLRKQYTCIWFSPHTQVVDKITNGYSVYPALKNYMILGMSKPFSSTHSESVPGRNLVRSATAIFSPK